MVGLIPVVVLVVAFVVLGQKERDFDSGVQAKIIVVVLAVVALSFVGLL